MGGAGSGWVDLNPKFFARSSVQVDRGPPMAVEDFRAWKWIFVTGDDVWSSLVVLFASGPAHAFAGEFDAVQDEISAVVEACGDATLKVILEVSELESYDSIRAASFIAMRAIREGDFIKTSTGKASGSATLANTQVMIEAIRDHYLATGVAIGMKPAGGIRNAKQALHYLVAVKETLGDAWLNSSRYRFGASSLLNDLLRQIAKEKTGAYQAPYYFTEAAESY